MFAIVDRPPLPFWRAVHDLARCVVATARLLAQGAIRQPTDHVARVLGFGDGTNGRVYRETVVPTHEPVDPAVLVVAFELRGVHGWGHALFRAESLLNTVLFVGFPGFVSKLWLAHDEHEVYRGFYQWDDARLADSYARALWWVLALVSVPGSIRYVVLPGHRRDDLLAEPTSMGEPTPEFEDAWWRLVSVAPPLRPR
jgi:hypothetical protein